VKHRYSARFDPPAPALPVSFRAPGELQQRAVEALIDTGADLCGVPESIADELELPPVRVAHAAGFRGASIEVVVYRVDLTIGGLDFPRVEALALGRPYGLIGRNVLRRLVARLDGPRSQLELTRGRGNRAR